MGLFSKLFGSRKRKRASPVPPPSSDHNPQKVEGALSKPVELTEEDRDLLTSLGISEATGLQLKAKTQNKLEGLFKQFLAESDRAPELRGIRSLYQGKDAAISRLNEQRSASEIHFFECGGFASDKNSYIAVVKTPDRYSILEIMETDGNNPHLPEMVKEAVVICPDLTAGDDAPEAIAEVLTLVRKSGEIYFWWD